MTPPSFALRCKNRYQVQAVFACFHSPFLPNQKAFPRCADPSFDAWQLSTCLPCQESGIRNKAEQEVEHEVLCSDATRLHFETRLTPPRVFVVFLDCSCLKAENRKQKLSARVAYPCSLVS